MYEKLSNAEIEFMEFWYDPVSMLENIFPVNLKAPSQWDENSETIRIRNYQFAMLGYDFQYATDFTKTKKQNMDLKKGAGQIYNISARNIGKSFLGLTGDQALAILHYDGIENCISSFDDFHVEKIGEPIVNLVENHRLFKMFHLKGSKKCVSRSPTFSVQTVTGHFLITVNENINSKNPGTGYHSLHYERFGYDEASYISEKGLNKRIDSISSNGYIERLFGIPDLYVGSPLGNILSDDKNKPWICRLPQFVREDWDDLIREEQAKKHGGENSLQFKLNVEGELLEGAFGKYDMDRIKEHCYNDKKIIKFFELSKDIFKDRKKFNDVDWVNELDHILTKKLILDRLPCTQIILASDIGTTGSPSEVIILFKSANGKWKYEYQISLFQMVEEEQAEIFNWIYNKLGSCFISLDCTNSDGRAIRRMLMKHGIPEENLTDFRMNQNLVIDFEYDKEGEVKLDKNFKPMEREENTKDFSIKCIERIFYGGEIEIPHDDKFFKQFSHFYEIVTGNKKKWGSSTEDHLHDSFLFFALCAWENENKNTRNQQTDGRCLGVI
jgi:hypothetical protein